MVAEFVRGMDLEAFRDDSKTVAAVERKLLIISEAAIRLGEDAGVCAPVCPGPTSAALATGSGIATTEWMSKPFGTQW